MLLHLFHESGERERVRKTMVHLNYNNIITRPFGRIASLAESGQQDRKTPTPNRSLMQTRNARWFGKNERALLVRLGKFLLVGGTGVLVNSLALYMFFQWLQLPLVVASALATELAIINNFCWNDRWTFGRMHFALSRFVQFNLVSLGGLIITAYTLWLLVHHLGLYYLVANLLSNALATAWNFAANLFWTWRGEQ